MRLKDLKTIHPLTHQGQPPHLLSLMPLPSVEQAIPAWIIACVTLHQYVAAETRFILNNNHWRKFCENVSIYEYQ